MDLLYQRYASPFSFMDGMIQTGRFEEFVITFCDTVKKEKDEKTSWEYFLHRVFDKSFEEFKKGMKNDNENKKMSKRTIETTVKSSMDILNQFNPAKGGET